MDDMLTTDKTNRGRFSLLVQIGEIAYSKDSWEQRRAFLNKLAEVMSSLEQLDDNDRDSLSALATLIGLSGVNSS